MTVKNLVSDFGAVADAVRQTLTLSISNGSPSLTVPSGVFSAADQTKRITFWHSNFGGIGGFSSTISTFTAGGGATDTLTLASNSTAALSAESCDVLWGTDNISAFTGLSGWRAWAQTQTDPGNPPILEIPDGNYAANFSAGSGQAINYGVLNSPTIRSVSGNAAACKIMNLGLGEIRLGGDPAIAATASLTNAGGNSVRLQTASAGATTVTLTNPSGTDLGGATYGSRVVVDRVCLLAAYDTQGLYEEFFGYPPNSFYFEWNVITAYNSGTGVVTLQNPLTQAYKSTYPRWGDESTIFGSDQGGPFTMWVAPDGYNNTVTLENFTLDNTHNQSAAHVRNLICNGMVMVGPGLYPTQADIVEMNDCVYPDQLEVDKMTNQVTWNNCTLNRLQQQSASPNKMYVNGGSIQILETAKYTEANNVTFTGSGTLRIGTTGYGRTDRAVINNCTGIASIVRGGCTSDDLGGSSGPGSAANASDFLSFVDGVIKFEKSINDGTGGIGNTGQQNITRGLMPGTWVTFDDKYMDRVTDVYEDGTYCYIQFANATDWPFTPVSRLITHPCPDFTMTNCTGTSSLLESLNNAPARTPIYSYSKNTYTADASGTSAHTSPTLLGRLVTCKFSVSTAYTGSLTYKQSQFNNWTGRKTDYSNYSIQADINIQTTGVRFMNAAAAATGTVSGDNLPDLTSVGPLWFGGGGGVGSVPVFSANVTNGETPTITVEITLNQGIPPVAVAPLRLRLRA
jgi:hypothetical protein